MGEYLLDRYDGMRDRDIPEEYREHVRRSRLRRERAVAAAGMGHPEWAELPPSAAAARVARLPVYFTGTACVKRHVAPRLTSDDTCTQCTVDTSDSLFRERERERALWASRFDMVARRMIETGRICYWVHAGRSGRIVETSVKVRWPAESVQAACAKAARQTFADGKLRCVVNGTRGMVTRMVAR